jgi:hypothetical protein
VPRLDEFGDVGVNRVIGHACERNMVSGTHVPTRKYETTNLRDELGIVVECFIKIPGAKEYNDLGILFFD